MIRKIEKFYLDHKRQEYAMKSWNQIRKMVWKNQIMVTDIHGLYDVQLNFHLQCLHTQQRAEFTPSEIHALLGSISPLKSEVTVNSVAIPLFVQVT
ncbi:hypothetical protein BpHYR1_041928 [Brachionus plicatilis]|uniref:Uncharacterized protein n=1 Tax=Brachionus plicatilis TaxID=10195 RepID=A0A3M7QPN7_BRAPC|nr:hypothetical protein BpHYR1_041928 [Brachionus plicatilis]